MTSSPGGIVSHVNVFLLFIADKISRSVNISLIILICQFLRFNLNNQFKPYHLRGIIEKIKEIIKKKNRTFPLYRPSTTTRFVSTFSILFLLLGFPFLCMTFMRESCALHFNRQKRWQSCYIHFLILLLLQLLHAKFVT